MDKTSATQPSAQESTEAPNGSLNRKQRRVLAKHQRKSGSAAEGVAAVAENAEKTLGDIQRLTTGLAQQQESLRQAFNQNHLAYSQAIGAVDGHIAVMRAVINAMHRGDVDVDNSGNINWELYYGWYNEHVQEEQKAAAEASKQAGTQVSAEEADEEIFGGDYTGGD